MKTVYYAKSKLPNGKQPTVAEHIQAVADKAEEYASVFDCGNEGRIAGLFHDFGKYGDRFQMMLKGQDGNVDHAVCGAAVLYGWKGGKSAYRPIIEAVNGHHDGLVGLTELEPKLNSILKISGDIDGNARKTAAISGAENYNNALRVFAAENKVTLNAKSHPAANTSELDSMLHTRMLFSCLVDADYSVSANEEDETYFDRSEAEPMDSSVLLQRLFEHRDSIRKKSDSASGVNQLRDQLFERCGEAGEQEGGLFTLTAPTGTGKTLALMHFALRHSQKWGKKRIIVVLPFLTLSDQIADTYKAIIPDVLIDNSQSDLNEESKLYAERWSAPVIITTTVRFFEGLFSNRPVQCRRLHSIADSVVLFDEAQSLPPHVTASTLKAVNALCEQYKCTMVFSTATQPDFDALPDVSWKPREIYPENAEAYNNMRRVSVDWRLDTAMTFEALAEEMSGETSVCAIVNLRRHASRLYSLLKEKCAEGTFYLTTDLCTAHRREIVDTIKDRMARGEPCRVVATQCIEAGVDMDFDVMHRSLAPLDAIIQAAGRCNRNGKLPEGGRVTVFIAATDGRLYPDYDYGAKAEAVRLLSSKHEIDINSPAHIKEYYDTVFVRAKDSKALEDAINARSYEDTDKEYKLIKNSGNHVIVQFIGQAELYNTLVNEIMERGLTKYAIKRAAPITVTTYDNDIDKYCERLYYSKNGRSSEKMPSDYFLLRPQYSELYTNDMGLQFPKNEENGKISIDNGGLLI